MLHGYLAILSSWWRRTSRAHCSVLTNNYFQKKRKLLYWREKLLVIFTFSVSFVTFRFCRRARTYCQKLLIDTTRASVEMRLGRENSAILWSAVVVVAQFYCFLVCILPPAACHRYITVLHTQDRLWRNRWHTFVMSVSYTHLDVYKRQVTNNRFYIDLNY